MPPVVQMSRTFLLASNNVPDVPVGYQPERCQVCSVEPETLAYVCRHPKASEISLSWRLAPKHFIEGTMKPLHLLKITLLAGSAALSTFAAVNCAHVTKNQSKAAGAKGADPADPPEPAKKHGCNTLDVKLAINPKNHKFTKQVDHCATSSWGGVQETADCLKKVYPGLSESCSLCFGKEAHCAVENCVLPCIFNHTSDRCAKCARTNCSDKQSNGKFSLETCTGLSVNEMPPKD